ncbi:MAG: type II toxin-antitoxin system RelB/DinJ family antitoxin [Kiritimatiellia bacterium]
MRIDDDLKRECETVLEDLGLSMSGAVTLFLKQVVKQRAIPFIISCDRVPSANYIGLRTSSLRERGNVASRLAAEMREASDCEWSMDEIDAEIKASRQSRRKTR